jgi:hypothetical protein
VTSEVDVTGSVFCVYVSPTSLRKLNPRLAYPVRVNLPGQFFEHPKVQTLCPIAHSLRGVGMYLDDEPASASCKSGRAERGNQGTNPGSMARIHDYRQMGSLAH